MKQISIFILGFAAACACVPALAQDLTAGKTPAQLFRSDCAECHRSPGAVASDRDVRTLTDFLREHYTTKPETAGALAAYVSGFAASSGRRNRGEAAANGRDARSKVKLIEDPAGRHRRTTRPSGDDEKRAADEDGDVPRPPGAIRTAPASSKSNARTRDGATRDAIEPFSPLRAYLQSAPGAENEVGEAGKAAAPKVRKRRNRANAAPPAPDEGQKTDVEPKD